MNQERTLTMVDNSPVLIRKKGNIKTRRLYFYWRY